MPRLRFEVPIKSGPVNRTCLGNIRNRCKEPRNSIKYFYNEITKLVFAFRNFQDRRLFNLLHDFQVGIFVTDVKRMRSVGPNDIFIDEIF